MRFFSIAVVSTLLAALSVSATQCSKSQFSHNSPRTGDCCLPNGGAPNPPSPPPYKSCPSKFQWHPGFSCCVPSAPNPPSNPTCPPSAQWDHKNQCCNHPTPPSPPTPSGGVGKPPGPPGPPTPPGPPGPPKPPGPPGHYKRSEAKSKIASRNWRAKTISCPTGQSICNVSDGLTKSNTWACVDTQKDVNFCGGCGNRSETGQDCSAIPNSWNVGCNAGKCQVFTCEPGFRVARDGKHCIAMD